MKIGSVSSDPNDLTYVAPGTLFNIRKKLIEFSIKDLTKPLELKTVTDVEMMPAPNCIVKNMTCSEFPLKSKCRGIGIGNFIYILTLWPLVLGRLISLLTLIEFGLVS